MNTQNDEIKRLVDEQYAQIEVPEGLEQRLSDKIDLWALEEERSPMEEKVVHFTPIFWARTASVAASLILLIMGTWFVISKQKPENVQIADTCTSVEDAYRETYDALNCISGAFGKGMGQVKESTTNISKTVSAANKYIVITDK